MGPLAPDFAQWAPCHHLGCGTFQIRYFGIFEDFAMGCESCWTWLPLSRLLKVVKCWSKWGVTLFQECCSNSPRQCYRSDLQRPVQQGFKTLFPICWLPSLLSAPSPWQGAPTILLPRGA